MAPMRPDSDSYRNSGWKPVVVERERGARVRGDAVGALDRDAPRQVRRRPVQLLVEEVARAARSPASRTAPGATMSAQSRTDASSGGSGSHAAIVPVMIPPYAEAREAGEPYEPSGWRTSAGSP